MAWILGNFGQCRPKLRSEIGTPVNVDRGWPSELHPDLYGLNLNEYQKRCRIRKLQWTPEQWEASRIV